MNSIRWTKGICWMLPASLVRIAVEKCILSTIKVPTVWNTSSQIIKKNNTTTQKKASGWFSPMLFLFLIDQHSAVIGIEIRKIGDDDGR